MSLWTKLVIFVGLLCTAFIILLLDAGAAWWQWVGVAVAGLVTAGVMRMWLRPLDEVTRTIEQIADGRLDMQELPTSGQSSEIKRLSSATNRMLRQLRDLSSQAERLAEGKIGVVEVEERVMKSGSLSDAELPMRDARGELERSFIALTNQMRRLTIQARVISQDHLYSPLLDERIQGELGDAFSLMVRNLRSLADRAKEIAHGDLTLKAEGTDGDLNTAFVQMVEGLKGLVQDITQTALHISSSAEQILAVLRDQEAAASHQASGVEETQRTMETLLSSAKKIAESAQTVFKSAEKTQANNRTVADRISELKQHTERIGEILEVIKSIADRSDLLALNASLEGMRAGEAGKGFTLVAAEMRRLAENIKDSVGDIKELLSDIRESSLSSVMATEEGTQLSEKTTESALKITLITQQQQSGTEQVTQSMDELSTLINQGVAGTRQVTTAASELVSMADDLRTLVEQFRVSPGPTTSGEFSAVSPPTLTAQKTRSAQQRVRRRNSKPGGRGLVETPVGLGTESEVTAAPSTEDRAKTAASSTEIATDGESDAAEKAGEDDEKASAVIHEDIGDSLRSTRMMLGGTGSGEDPPTVEFSTSITEDEEKELLEELVRSRERKRGDEKPSVDEQIDELEKELTSDETSEASEDAAEVAESNE